MRKHHSRIGTDGNREQEQPGKEGRAHSVGKTYREALVDGQKEMEDVCPQNMRPQVSKE